MLSSLPGAQLRLFWAGVICPQSIKRTFELLNIIQPQKNLLNIVFNINNMSYLDTMIHEGGLSPGAARIKSTIGADGVTHRAELSPGCLWAFTQAFLLLPVADARLRMSVIRLRRGAFWLHSPVRPTPQLLAWLAAEGLTQASELHIVAPSNSPEHWAWSADWAGLFPSARLWAAPGLRPALETEAGGVPPGRVAGELRAQPPLEWEGEIDHAQLGDALFRETAFFHRRGQTLALRARPSSPEQLHPIHSNRIPPGRAASPAPCSCATLRCAWTTRRWRRSRSRCCGRSPPPPPRCSACWVASADYPSSGLRCSRNASCAPGHAAWPRGEPPLRPAAIDDHPQSSPRPRGCCRTAARAPRCVRRDVRLVVTAHGSVVLGGAGSDTTARAAFAQAFAPELAAAAAED